MRQGSKLIVLVMISAVLSALTAPLGLAASGDEDDAGASNGRPRVLSFDNDTRRLRIGGVADGTFEGTLARRSTVIVDGEKKSARHLGAGDRVLSMETRGNERVTHLRVRSKPSGASCNGVTVQPESDMHALVESSPGGTTFCLTTGTHRVMKPVAVKSGQTFVGEPGTIVSGARSLSFIPEGNVWVATGQTQESTPHGECSSGTACQYNEDVFFDNRLLSRVGNLSKLGPGEFFFDYADDKIYIADDPSGHLVEGAVSPLFLQGGESIDNVTVKQVVVEKFATPAQQGALDANDGSGWRFVDNEVRLNHGVGIIANSNGRVVGNLIHHNGQHGLGADGNDILIEANEISYSNTVGFSPGWSAGGAKFALTNRLTVRNNHVHHNNGPGLWTDVDNINTVYEKNVVEDNTGMGIFHEISYDAVIRNNVVRRNGHSACQWLYGAGILVAHSPNVEVYGNTVEDNCNGIVGIQQDRGSGPYGPHELRNLHVHDNTVRMPSGQSGVADDSGGTAVYTSRNNRFESNTYKLDPKDSAFGWMNQAMNKAQWQAAGQDRDGRFLSL